MSSLWIKSTTLPEFESLGNDLNCENLIIGGGLVGLLTAYKLVKNNQKVVLIEANKLMQSTSGKSTGKITSQHGYFYYDLINKKGIDFASNYLLANEKAIKEYQQIINELQIECDFKIVNSYLYAINDDEETLLNKELNAYQQINADGYLTNNIKLPIVAKKALLLKNQAQFNPYKFALGIVNYLVNNNVLIYENTRAIDIQTDNDNHIIKLKDNYIVANKVIVATHYPIINIKSLLFTKMYANKDYIVATKIDENIVDGNYINICDPTISLRMNQDYLLIAGLDHRTGTKNDTRGYFTFLKTISQKITRQNNTFEWSSEDCMTIDKIPYIGYLSKTNPHLFIATGFNKWGITNSMIASNIISDYLLEKTNEFAYLYDPSRFSVTTKLFNHAWHSLISLTAGIFSEKRCTHMGCKLNYNKAENTWDCPCHGSSFDKDGNVLYSPATKELKL